MEGPKRRAHHFAFSLRALLAVVSAGLFGMGLSVNGPSLLLLPWVALCAPAYIFVSLLVTHSGYPPGYHFEVIFSIATGLLYGMYATIAVLSRKKWPLVVALALHGVCVFFAIRMMMASC